MARWCGFNLCEMFVTPDDERWPDMTPAGRGRFREDDFAWIRDWGFNFVRLPLTYRYWSPHDSAQIYEEALEPIDRAIEVALACGLHVSLAMHHAPGYCVNPPMRREARLLWTSETAQADFGAHWAHLARRYRAVDANKLSFNLLNEPSGVDEVSYRDAMKSAIETIRHESADRLIVVDGLEVGTTPVRDLIAPGILQSCRGYTPPEVTHHRAWWAGFHQHPPAWPLTDVDGSVLANRSTLEARLAPWRSLRAEGVGVHCGEFGTYKHTPHGISLAWMRDWLELLKAADIGFALWNFRGSFGVLNSGRTDVNYVNWHGYPLDLRMLRLLQSNC